MDSKFKEKVILALIAGVFMIVAAMLSTSDGGVISSGNHVSYNSNNSSTAIANGGNAIAISNSGGNSSSISNTNVSIQDNRVSAGNGGTAISINSNNSDIKIDNSFNEEFKADMEEFKVDMKELETDISESLNE